MKYAKAILAAIFGLSPAAVVGVLALFKVHVDETTVTWLLGALSPLLATLGVAVGPKNREPGPKPVQTTQGSGLPADIAALWAQHAQSADPATGVSPIPENLIPKS